VELLLLYHLPLGGIFFFGKTPAGFHLGSGGKGEGQLLLLYHLPLGGIFFSGKIIPRCSFTVPRPSPTTSSHKRFLLSIEDDIKNVATMGWEGRVA
jgi:hypothetical protein